MSYSLGAKFLSELIGMALTIFIGESIIANELLPSTKGHGMGFLAVAFGFGLAFGVNITWFGFISAHLNPAMFFFLAILGKLQYGWVEFAVGSCGDFVGAFLGAILVYLFFSEHFETVPLPQDNNPVAVLLHGPADALSDNAGRIASAFGPASRPVQGGTLKQEFVDAGRNIAGLGDAKRPSHSTEDRQKLMEKMEVRRQCRVDTRRTDFFKRQNTIQVAGILHQHDPSLPRSDELSWSRHSVQVAGMLHTHDTDGKEACACDTKEDAPQDSSEENAIEKEKNAVRKEMQARQEILDATHKAALEADAHAKLSIFATRPAKYNRIMCFYQEMIATAVLVFGAEMFNLRYEYDITRTDFVDGQLTKTLFVSFFITALILGLGGSTGLAVNPARDLGPRLAHAILPIPGKGESEFHYAWVPFFAPFVGGALGAALFAGVQALFVHGRE